MDAGWGSGIGSIRQDSHDPCTEWYDTMQSSRLLSWLSVQYAAIAGKEPGTRLIFTSVSLLLMPLPPLHQPNDHMVTVLSTTCLVLLKPFAAINLWVIIIIKYSCPDAIKRLHSAFFNQLAKLCMHVSMVILGSQRIVPPSP